MTWHQSLSAFARQRRQVFAQTIDDTVERLVRNRLALVTAALQNQCVRKLLFRLFEKRLHQRALAHPGKAAHVNRDGLTTAHGAKRIIQFGKLTLAPDKFGFRSGYCERGSARLQEPQYGAAFQTILRPAAQKIHAKFVEIIRNSRVDLDWLNRPARLLANHDLKKFAGERKAAGEGFVEHHADAVPVAG